MYGNKIPKSQSCDEFMSFSGAVGCWPLCLQTRASISEIWKLPEVTLMDSTSVNNTLRERGGGNKKNCANTNGNELLTFFAHTHAKTCVLIKHESGAL